MRLRHSEKLRYLSTDHGPIRFGVINRHIVGNKYEVYLLTTFGGATYHQALDGVARMFAMPMGFTKWPVDIPGIKTKPNTFGKNTSSFLFALPTECEIISPKVPARVPLEELHRIRVFAEQRKQVRYLALPAYYLHTDQEGCNNSYFPGVVWKFVIPWTLVDQNVRHGQEMLRAPLA